MLSLLLAFGMGPSLSGNEYIVDYTVKEEGPRIVYEGTAAFQISGAPTMNCLYHEFEVPREHELAGPVSSSKSGEPILQFDSVTRIGHSVAIEWCIFTPSAQILPYSIPRHFVFYSVKTKFNSTDLEKLLSDWGLEDSPWDLDLDGTVGGADLAKLLSGWNGA